MFFFFFFLFLFLPMLQSTVFPSCQLLKPPPLHCTSPLKPHKSHCHHCLIHGHTSKDMFFFFFFRSFSDQCYRDPLYPMHWDLKPLPLHHIIPIPMSHPSSLASPHCHCLAACKL